MSSPVFVLASDNSELELDALGAETIRSSEEFTKHYRGNPDARWIGLRPSALKLLRPASGLGPRGRLLLLSQVAPNRLAFLYQMFEEVVAGATLLQQDELWEALASPDNRDLFIGGIPDQDDQVLVLYRGDLSSLAVPFSWFEPRPGGRAPVWHRFNVIDGGQTIKLGDYEAAADAILYDLDADYRRRAKKRVLESDDSFGASLRRLRLQRGLRRGDFAPVSEKEIARLERNEVRAPHRGTLGVVAARLGVELGEIGTY